MEPFASTRMLSAAALGALVADDGGRLHFSGTPAELTDIRVDAVIVAGISDASPRGLCRIVTGVSSEGGDLLLSTADVPLQLAFRKLHLRAKRRALPALGFDGPKSSTLVSGGAQKTDAVDVFAFNGDGDASTPDDQVRVSGELGGGLTYAFGIDVDWGEVMNLPKAVYDCLHDFLGGGDCSVSSLLPPVQAGMDIEAQAAADLTLQGSAYLGYATEHQILSVDLTPFMIGPIPILPELEVRSEIEGEASSEFSVQGHASASITAGASFSTKEGVELAPPQGDVSFSAPVVDAKLSAGARVAVGPRLTARAFGLMGPYAGLRVFSELSASQQASPCWSLHGGVTGEVGFDVSFHLPKLGEVNIADAHQIFTVVDQPFGSGQCAALPADVPENPVAGVPSPQAFAQPSFSPWAKSYADISSDHPAQATGAGPSWMEATGTIDGRFMVAGSSANVLTKLDPDGTPVWARKFLSADPWPDGKLRALSPSRVVPRKDAGMFVVAYPWGVLDVRADGELVWARRFDATYQSQWLRFTAAVPLDNGGVLLVGNRAPSQLQHLDGDVWLVALNAEGDVAWSKRWGQPGQGEVAWTAFPADGDVIVAGARHFDDDLWRPWALRVTQGGLVKWAVELSVAGAAGPERAFFTTGTLTPKGEIVLAGSVDTAPRRGLVAKLDANGDLAWTTSEGVEGIVVGPEITSIVALPSTGYLIAGDYMGQKGAQDVFVASLDGSGHTAWMRRYGGSGAAAGGVYDSDTHPGLTLTQDGGVLLTAYTDSLAASGLFAAKLPAKDGLITFAQTSDAESADLVPVPASFSVSRAALPTSTSDEPAEALAMTVSTEAVTVVGHAETP